MNWFRRSRRSSGDVPADRGSKDEAEARKARSIARLRSEGIPVLANLPVIETEAESLRRSSAEVAHRAMALHAVAVKGEGHGQASSEEVMAVTAQIVDEFQLAPHFTPLERRFIEDPNPTEMSRVQFSWRYECYWALLWALGFVDTLATPADVCDVPHAVGIMRTLGRTGFLEQVRLRPQAALLDEADLIYRYDWAVVNARLKGEAVEGLDSGVVVERHYALNWLIGYRLQAWDDISTDT